MKKPALVFVLLGVLWMGSLPGAGVAAEVQVREAVVARGVENRQPVGTAETFPVGTERVYAFTRIVGMEDPGRVNHVWYHAGRIVAQVELSVRSPDWRTWSSKVILPTWTGEWLVEIVAADGKVLYALPFTVE